MSSVAFDLIVLQISTYSIRCLLALFSATSRCSVIKARAGDDILDFCGILIVLATLDALSWIMSVLDSTMVSFSSSIVVSRIGFSILFGTRTSLIHFFDSYS